ncbi:DUF177 domain-containing protein [Clostridiales bacterium COT073_COT-073]|nr:DUF177 domain-containing protein [Clostridiales bacterium COT073_COT-073]
MKINLDELFYEQDDVRLVEELPARGIEVSGSLVEMTAEPVKAELDFHKTNEQEVFLRGQFHFGWQLICDRCMANVSKPMDLSFTRDILLEEDGHILDLDELIREEAILNFPTKVLCKEECLGICPDCGKNKNDEACECHQAGAVDIRFAGLKELFENNFKEV